MTLKNIIKIKNRLIGKNYPVFIIAEGGVNHNGNLSLAKKMVNLAKLAGADAIKFQTFKAEDVVTKDAQMAEYQRKSTGKKQTQLEMLKKIELSNTDFKEIKVYCDKKKIIFLSTPHSNDAADFLEPLVPAYKIGSGDLTNLPFLKKIAKKRKPIILSTGMSFLSEIREAIEIIKKNGNKEIILLHCTSNYPCQSRDVNLKAMVTLKEEFGLSVGYSDHTDNFLAPVMAVAMGACILEKHFTINKNLTGPDQSSSMNAEDFGKMVSEIREAEKIMGEAEKKPTSSEIKIMKIVRKSIIARRDILKGEKIKEDMIVVKRPGSGIEPKYINKIIGRIAKKEIRQDEVIVWKNI